MKWRPMTRTVGNARVTHSQSGVTVYTRDAGNWRRTAWFSYALDAKDFAIGAGGWDDLADAIDAASDAFLRQHGEEES